MIFLAAAAGYAVFVAALLWFLRSLRPAWSASRAVVTANVPGPLLALAALVWLVAALGPAPEGEIDATGMAMMVYMVGGAVVIASMIFVGTVAGLLTLRMTH